MIQIFNTQNLSHLVLTSTFNSGPRNTIIRVADRVLRYPLRNISRSTLSCNAKHTPFGQQANLEPHLSRGSIVPYKGYVAHGHVSGIHYSIIPADDHAPICWPSGPLFNLPRYGAWFSSHCDEAVIWLSRIAPDSMPSGDQQSVSIESQMSTIR